MRTPMHCTLLLATAACTLSVQAGPVTKIEALGALATPATLTYGHAFNDLNPAAPGLQISQAGVPITLQAGEDFHDLYLFTTGTALASFITLTIDLGNVFNIDSLTLSLYDAAGLPAAALGTPAGLSTLPAVARSVAESRSGLGEQQVIQPLTLAAGSYVLDVQGLVTGASGGSYSGVVNLAAVPEPATSALVLLAALLGVLPTATGERRQRPNPKAGVRMDYA